MRIIRSMYWDLPLTAAMFGGIADNIAAIGEDQ
jgi:hypothetical protein